MTMSASPRRVADYREQTKKPPIPGEWYCKAGKHYLFPREGRKQHLSGKGWTCAACVLRRKGGNG